MESTDGEYGKRKISISKILVITVFYKLASLDGTTLEEIFPRKTC